MTIRCLLVSVIAVVLFTGILVGSSPQGPKKDVGKDVPLTPTSGRTGPPSKGGDQVTQAPGLSIDVDVVSFDVVVTDQSGNPIGGLEKKHFSVFDDDVEQTMTNFSSTEAPLTDVILAEFS